MNIVVPYGEKKGRRYPVHRVPSPILKWLAENAYNDKIATECDKEWQWREKLDEHFDDWDD